MPSTKDEMTTNDQGQAEEVQPKIEESQAEGQEPAEEAAVEAETADAVETVSVQELQEKIEKLETMVKEKDDRGLRLQADFDNFRRRTRQEKEDLTAVVTQTILTDMLPLLDNFERALAVESTDKESFQNGVEMIYKQFKAALEKNGLEAIKTEGEKFDPNFHQAVMRVEDAEREDDTIASELQKGYMVKGHVIRPSMVQVVSN